MSSTISGTYKWFYEPKGFGFIEQKSISDLIEHYRSVVSTGFKTHFEGQMVDAIIALRAKEFQAENIAAA